MSCTAFPLPAAAALLAHVHFAPLWQPAGQGVTGEERKMQHATSAANLEQQANRRRNRNCPPGEAELCHM